MAKKPVGKYSTGNRYSASRAKADAEASTNNPVDTQQQEEEKKKRRWLLLLLLLLLLIIKGLLLYIFWGDLGLPDIFCPRPTQGILAPDYTSRPIDPGADPIPGDSGTKIEIGDCIEGEVNLIYSDNVIIDLSSKKVTLNFQNPSRSTSDIIVQVVIQDTLIAESGVVQAGFKISQIDLAADAQSKLAPGIYEGKFTFHIYNPETGDRAMVNVESPITVDVQK